MSKAPTTSGVGKRQHYWLMAGTIMFADKDKNHFEKTLNTLLVGDHDNITRHDLGKIQQGLQMRLINETFHGQMPAEVQILDVVILGGTYLGRMTEAEFHKGFEADGSRTQATPEPKVPQTSIHTPKPSKTERKRASVQ
jgi:hypothetical protein